MRVIPIWRETRKRSGRFRVIGYSLVDNEDFPLLNHHRWLSIKSHSGKGYAGRFVWEEETGKRKILFMHREILKMGSKSEDPRLVDHINLNTLDNRKDNLRIGTPSQACINRHMAKKNLYGLKGVTPTRSGRWVGHLGYQRRNLYLGTYDSIEEAGLSYNLAASSLFSEFSNPNPLPKMDPDKVIAVSARVRRQLNRLLGRN